MITSNAEFTQGYKCNPLERIHKNVILAQLQEEEESCSAAQKAAMELKEAEKAYTDVQTNLQLYETAKKEAGCRKGDWD